MSMCADGVALQVALRIRRDAGDLIVERFPELIQAVLARETSEVTEELGLVAHECVLILVMVIRLVSSVESSMK